VPTSTITSKGQTTIPKEIRSHLHLQPGDRLEFIIDSDGRVVIMPATMDASELAGILPTSRRTVTLEEMKRTIRRPH